MDQVFTTAQFCQGSWKYANPVYICFVDLEKSVVMYLESCCVRYRVSGFLLHAIQCLYECSEKCLHKSGMLPSHDGRNLVPGAEIFTF